MTIFYYIFFLLLLSLLLLLLLLLLYRYDQRSRMPTQVALSYEILYME